MLLSNLLSKIIQWIVARADDLQAFVARANLWQESVNVSDIYVVELEYNGFAVCARCRRDKDIDEAWVGWRKH